jgi:DNA-directed RNA polymerase subunit RPC12/RpoP
MNFKRPRRSYTIKIHTFFISITLKDTVVRLSGTDSTGEKSSLTCPKCGSKNTKIIDLTILVPVLKCSDCGTEWMPAPEGIGAGLAGNHPRDFESEGNTEKKR